MKTSSSDNNSYPQFCKLAVEDDTVFMSFKTSPAYTKILEHVTFEEGMYYYNHFKHNTDIISRLNKFKINDSVGAPKMYDYEFGKFSPTTLRYIKVLSDLSQLKLDGMDIIEIGAGYGGQYVTLRQYAKPKSYTIIDLPDVIELQQKYIEANNLNDIEINFYSIENLPRLSGDLLISNYALSECITQVQDVYIEKIINNCKRGYIIHNRDTGYTSNEFKQVIKHNVKQFKELPSTSPNNVLLTW
jgi:putative sugar O-methyltransferase